MNRAYRRKNKKKPRYHKETTYEAVQRLLKTGDVTIKDLERNYNIGYRAAMDSMEQYLVPFFYAALACALKKTFKFGEERIIRTISATIQTMNEEISVEDMLERCKRETGIDIVNYTKEEPLG